MSGRPDCDRCGKAYVLHTGAERFCPFYSTYRAPSGMRSSVRCAAETTVATRPIRCERDANHDGAHRFTMPTGWGV